MLGLQDVGVAHEELRELVPALGLLVEVREPLADVGVLRVRVERALERLLDAGVVTGLLARLCKPKRHGDRLIGGRDLEDLRQGRAGLVPRAALFGETCDRLERARMVRVLVEEILVGLQRRGNVLHARLEDVGDRQHAFELERRITAGRARSTSCAQSSASSECWPRLSKIAASAFAAPS